MKKYTKPDLTIASFEAKDNIALTASIAQPTPNQIDLGKEFPGTINFK